MFRLPLAVSVTHACLAQAFLCLVIALAVCTAYAVVFAGIGIRWFQWGAR